MTSFGGKAKLLTIPNQPSWELQPPPCPLMVFTLLVFCPHKPARLCAISQAHCGWMSLYGVLPVRCFPPDILMLNPASPSGSLIRGAFPGHLVLSPPPPPFHSPASILFYGSFHYCMFYTCLFCSSTKTPTRRYTPSGL